MHISEVLSKRDAVSLLYLINQCISCTKEDDFRDIIESLRNLFYHDYAIGVVVETDRCRALRSFDAINFSYPSEWIALYIAQEEHKQDPVFRANFENFRLQYFKDILARYDYPKEGKAIANDFGIVDGYVHGFKNHAGLQESMFCFAGKKMDRDKRTEVILELITPHLHEAFLRVIKHGTNGHNGFRPISSSLSQKEKETLKWLAHGKSTWDISVLLGISERTVKFHIGNITRKLDASTRAHAVAIAIEQGLIDIE